MLKPLFIAALCAGLIAVGPRGALAGRRRRRCHTAAAGVLSSKTGASLGRAFPCGPHPAHTGGAIATIRVVRKRSLTRSGLMFR